MFLAKSLEDGKQHAACSEDRKPFVECAAEDVWSDLGGLLIPMSIEQDLADSIKKGELPDSYSTATARRKSPTRWLGK